MAQKDEIVELDLTITRELPYYLDMPAIIGAATEVSRQVSISGQLVTTNNFTTVITPEVELGTECTRLYTAEFDL